MLTLTQSLQDTAGRGEALNLVFEQRLFDLAGDYRRGSNTSVRRNNK